jgi:hypothetical protein
MNIVPRLKSERMGQTYEASRQNFPKPANLSETLLLGSLVEQALSESDSTGRLKMLPNLCSHMIKTSAFRITELMIDIYTRGEQIVRVIVKRGTIFKRKWIYVIPE